MSDFWIQMKWMMPSTAATYTRRCSRCQFFLSRRTHPLVEVSAQLRDEASVRLPEPRAGAAHHERDFATLATGQRANGESALAIPHELRDH